MTTRKLLFIAAAVIAGAVSCSKSPLEKKVDEIVSKMSLEEKIGQMVQLNVTVVTDKEGKKISEQGEQIIRQYKIGSILNTPGDKGSTTVEHYRDLIAQLQDISLDEMGIPCIYGLDQIHGATYTTGATFFPQEVNIAATFDTKHAANMGKVLAYETRACNVPWVFSPVMDLGRNPVWPRVWESYGEDVCLTKAMAVAETVAIQGEDKDNIDEYHTAVSLKHYMAYGMPVSGQDRTPSMVSYRDLMERFFQPFKACVEAGALTIMVNSAINDGIPFHSNKELLTGWVKEGLNWDGFFVTDWADVKNIHSRDHVAASTKEAAMLAVNAGIDMIMDPYTPDVCTELLELVKEGKVSKERIDDAARRIIRAKLRMGLFDDPYGKKGSYEKFACEEHVAMAYQAAVEGEVLLKNEGAMLPLSKDAKILLVGPNANSMRTLNGGWSYSWQGDKAASEEMTGQYNTILEALQAKFKNVKYHSAVEYYGARWQDDRVTDLSAAVRDAASCDVIVACIGENTYCETPGNTPDILLSSNQRDMVKALAATGKPVVLILNEGRPRIISDIEPLAKAVIDIMLPSNYGADALAALLCGEENFSGRLPFTYPKYPNRYTPYDYYLSENVTTMAGAYNYDAKVDAQWNFGDGLSYTTFEYSDMTVDKTDFKAGDMLTVSVNVKNTGERAGKESVLLFSSDIYASVAPSVRRLRDFKKVEIPAGESVTVEFSLPAESLAFAGHDLKWHLEPGEFRLAIGSESVSVNCVE